MNEEAMATGAERHDPEAAVQPTVPKKAERKRSFFLGRKKKTAPENRESGGSEEASEAVFPSDRKGKHKLLRWFGVALALAGIALISAVVFILASGIGDNREFEISFYPVPAIDLEHSMRIVLLSDLHNHEYGGHNQELLDAIEACHPDMICIVGDMMNREDTDYHVVIDLLNALREREIAPVFYAYGNHEMDYIYETDDRLDSDIRGTGVTVLRNSYTCVEVAGNTVYIAGLSTRVQEYEEYGAADMMEDFQQTPGFRLLLAHYPHYFTDIFSDDNTIDVNLALCGHAHGGLIRLPKLGGVYASGQGFLPELTEGKHQYGDCTVIVSRGLGGKDFPVRLNNRPELVVLDVGRTATQLYEEE